MREASRESATIPWLVERHMFHPTQEKGRGGYTPPDFNTWEKMGDYIKIYRRVFKLPAITTTFASGELHE